MTAAWTADIDDQLAGGGALELLRRKNSNGEKNWKVDGRTCAQQK